jgi:hypothetical protein
MKSRFGNLIRTRDGLLFGKPRKKYTRTHPYPKNTMRIKSIPREKAAIVMLRKLGYSMNMIAKALGRSRSLIHRTLRFNISIKNLNPMNMRKLPNQIRLRCSSIRWNTLMRLWPVWEAWILGEGEKPP